MDTALPRKCFSSKIVLLCASLWIISISCLPVDPDKPLFLTQYIDSNAIVEGRRAAEVDPFIEGVKSYSGLLTVDRTLRNHMFFWYFPAEEQPKTAPLIISLNGYSTASSYAVFLQTGPYVFESGKLKRTNISWQKMYHVVYIDNPVGVGFSYTETPDGYSKDLDKIGSDLFETLLQFLQLFPELAHKELYISGTSTAGKYVPALAYKIIRSNLKPNLKGLFLGNPFFDPSQIRYGIYLYEHGLVDLNEVKVLDKKEKDIRASLKEKKYYDFYEKVISYLTSKNSSYILNVTGLKSRYDVSNVVINATDYLDFIKKSSVKKQLHVGNLSFNDGAIAMNIRNFAKSYAFSVKPWLEDILTNQIKVVAYNGQRDIAWAYPMMSEVLTSLDWKGARGYRSASRIKLKDMGDLVGYLRNYEYLTDVFVLNAGHSAVTYQPKLVLQLLNNLTHTHYSV